MTKTNMVVRESLSIVTLNGFDPKPETEEEGAIDLPGSANWLIDQFGMARDLEDPEAAGILWCDYDDTGWVFRVLIDSTEVGDLRSFAEEAVYDVVKVEVVTEPTHFGDGSGTVEILKHRDGWVVCD